MEERQELDWIPLTSRANGDARPPKLPLSRASIYRLSREGLIKLQRMDKRVCVLKAEVDGILALLKSKESPNGKH